MTHVLTTSPSALQHAVSATVEALFGVCNEISPSDAQFDLAGAVGISGATTATVIVRVDDLISRRYASEMFGQSESEVTPTDIADALLELTNVLGGAAKTALDGECVLTLPWIVPVDERSTSEVESEAGHDNVVAYEIYGGTLSVSIVSERAS